MKWLALVTLALSVSLFTCCSGPVNSEGTSAAPSPSGRSPASPIADADWNIEHVNSVRLKGQLSSTCSKQGYCWYWKASTLWLEAEGRVDEVRLPLRENDLLVHCFLLSPQVGWIVSNDSLFKTSDGGSSWNRISVPAFESGKGRIYAAQFLDEKLGWLVGGEYRPRLGNEIVPNNAMSDDRQSVLVPAVLKTVDGGLHWVSTRIVKSIGRLDQVHFVANLGLVAGDAGLHATTDGGSTWKDVLSTFPAGEPGEKPQVNSVFVLDEQRAWISLSGGRLLKTHDGARSWKEITVTELSSADGSFREMVFVSDLEGLALQNRLGFGELHKTKDGGTTWTRLPINASLSGLALINDLNRVIVHGDNGIYNFTPK